MASFIGTNKEFRRYIGPMLRNLVQQFTKKHKAEISACEHCGTRENLESAHVHGRDRNEIIDLVLNENTHNGIATIDIGVFEERFKEEHLPLEKSILILCRNCHKKYDTKAPRSIPTDQVTTEPQNRSPIFVNDEGYLPIILEPSDPDIFKQELLVSKRAVIETTYANGRVERKSWNASNFRISSNVFGNLRSRSEYRSGNWQARGIVKVHVRVVNNA
jgi:hypothetical protein